MKPRELRELCTWFEKGPFICTTEDEARAWFVAEVDRVVARGVPRAAASEHVRGLIGYATGSYPLSIAERMFDLFGAAHPIFGTPAERALLSKVDMTMLSVALTQIARNKVEARA